MNENDNIQYLYDNLKKNNYLTEGSIDDFRAYLEDEGNRQSLYDNLKKKNFLTEGSVDDFNAWLGIGKQPAPRVDVSDVEAQQQPQVTAMESPANGTEQADIPTVTMEQVETAEEQPKQPAWMPNRMGGVGGEQNYMPQQTNYIERSKQEQKKVLNEEETAKIETLNNLDNTLGEIKQKRRQGFWKTVGGMFGDLAISGAMAEGGMSYEDQEQLRKVQDDIRKTNSVNMAINQNLHDAENTINIARKNIEEGEGSVAVKLGRGVRYANLDNVIPVSELYGQMGVLQLYDKLNEDGTPKEPLTEDEQTLYEALALNQYAQQAFGGDINMLNRIGKGLPEQAMFTLSFLLSSEFAGAQAIGKGATKALQRGISKGIKREIKTNLGKFMLDKALPTAFGMGAETLYRTGLQAGNIAEGAIERHVGNIRIDPETGEIGGFEKGVDWGEAVWKSAASVANENATELLGDKVFEPGWAWLGRNTKAGKKIADFRKAIGKMGNGKVDDILKMGNSISEKAGWQGWAFETLEELAGNFNDAAFIHDQTWEQAFSKETLMETTLNCMIFGMAMGTSTTSLQALRNMPSAVETRNTKRLASSIIGRMDDISTDEIDQHIENDNTNDLSQWLVAKYDQGGWTDAQRTAVANYVRATVAQKAQRNFKDMQLQEEVNAMEERVDDMTNRQSGDVIEANFMVDGQMQTGTIVGGRVSVMENDVMDADGNPKQAYVYNPNLSSVTVTVRMEDGTKKQISARDIESINSVTDTEQYKAERTQELTQAMQDSVKAMYEPPTLSEIWGVDLQPGVMLTINGENWIITKHFDDGRWGFTSANPDGTPNGQSGMVMSDSDLRTAGLLERLNAMQQQGASEEEMDDVVSDLNAEEGLKNIEASDNEDNIWDAVAGFMQGYFKTNEEGDPIPEESRPEAVAGYLVALQKGDIGKTIGIVDARIAELQTRLMAKPEQVENNGEGVVGMAANQSLADSAAEDIKKEIGFLEMVREGLVAKQEEQAQMKAQQSVSQMEAGTEFPVDWNGTPAVAVVEGRDADGRNLVTVYDANDRDGLPLQAGIEVSAENDAEWEARRVRPQEQQPEPPMESAGNGTEQVQPEPAPQPEPTPQPTPTPVQPEPAPQQEQPQAEYPKDKQGKPQYDMIDDPNVFLQALVDEWGDDALGALDDIIEDTREGLEQKSKLEQRRINKRLAMLEAVRGMMQPQEQAQEDGTDRTEATDETPAAPVEEVPSEQPAAETSGLQGLDGYSESDIEGLVRQHIESVLEGSDADIEIVGIKVIGSRTNGTANEGSDLDVLVEYKGDATEDGLFNLFNDEENRLYIEGVPVDINPITEGKSGTIEQFMARNEGYKKPAEEAPAETPMESAVEGTEQTEEPEQAPEQPAESVPDWTEDTAKAARERGYRMVDGERVDRQEPIDGVEGNEVEVKFSDTEKPKGKWMVVEAESLQPSHRNKRRNPRFFITEAQPKERTTNDDESASTKIAKDINPSEVTDGNTVTAYGGAPIINSRGEVIQGNNRTIGMQKMYESYPESQKKYKDYLIEHAEQFGLDKEAIGKMQHPVLVRSVDVDDDTAIKLGQKTSQDTESGGKQRMGASQVRNGLGDKYANLIEMLFADTTEDEGIGEAIARNGVTALKYLWNQKVINNTQYQSALENGDLTAEAKEDFRNIIMESLFEGGPDGLRTAFNMLPAKSQNAILQTIYRDAKSNDESKIKGEVQQAIMAFANLMGFKSFAAAKNQTDVENAVNSWLGQQNMFSDVANTEKYSNFALELAKRFKWQTLTGQRAFFNELYDKLQGVASEGLSMFEEVQQLGLAEAIKAVYGIDYLKPQQNNGISGSNVVADDNGTRQEGEQGGTAETESGERAESGERPADDRGGDERADREGQETESGEKVEQAAEVTPTQGENTIFTEDEKDRRIEALKRRHRSQLNIAIDPQDLGDMLYVAGYHIEKGIRKFADFCKNMIEDLGDWVRPYLKQVYQAAKYDEDIKKLNVNRKEWSSEEEVDDFDVENFDKQNQSTNKQDDFIAAVEQRMADGKQININVLRALAASLEMGEVKDTELQEMTERAIINMAKRLVADGKSEKETFDSIVKLYNAQPTISMRSSERVEKQQYSTPIPMAYLADMFVKNGLGNGIVLEPSAGNGMMVFGLPSAQVEVNEIDPVRARMLAGQGFRNITMQDGRQPFDGKYDGIVTNPPFGSSPEINVDGTPISGLEEQMVINALNAMKDDGKAAIIIGGHTKYTNFGALASQKGFFNYLYSRYNVVDVINVNGDLYAKQGTKYPVRLILIDGRKSDEQRIKEAANAKGGKVLAPVKQNARAEVVNTFEELYNRVSDDIQNQGQRQRTEADKQQDKPSERTGNATNGNTQQPGRNGESVGGDGVLSNPSVQPDMGGVATSTGRSEGNKTGVNDKTNSGEPNGKPASPRVSATQQRNETGAGEREGGKATDTQQRTERNADTGRTGLDRGASQLETPKKVQVNIGDEKVAYPKQSKSNDVGTVVPAAQAQALGKVLSDFGDIDQFVQDELGYSSKEEMYNALSAEQVDGVALAIKKAKEGKALIIGDETGIGKGRQAAAMIRWAVRQGKKPIFVTEKPDLFSDIYRDLVDIGSGELVPFIVNAREAKSNITDNDGNVVYKGSTPEELKRVEDYVGNYGTLPDGYDFAVITYSQLQDGTMDYEDGIKKARSYGKKQPSAQTLKNKQSAQAKRDMIEKLANGNYIVMDEAHNAAGTNGGGAMFWRFIVPRTKAVTFLSATFAKRPENMPIFALKTSISEANVSPEELIQAIEQGGVTLQEIMSKGLVENGEMVRRAKSFEGVTVDWLPMKGDTNTAKEKYNTTIELFNDIIQFQREFIDPIVNGINEEIAEMQEELGHKKGTANMGVTNTPFASKTFNLVRQIILMSKVEEAADMAIEEFKAGRKPLIALDNTMEGFMNEAFAGLDSEGAEEPDFSLVFKKGLDGVFRMTRKDSNGNESDEVIRLSDLPKDGQERYHELVEKINKTSVGLSISPIDAIKRKMTEAGLHVGELTGRHTEMVYNEDGTVKVQNRRDRDKKKIMREFNNGDLDAIIINKSSSTGVSLHSNKKFKDQRPRTMIIAQSQLDVNGEVQMRGRINRTGQVNLPKYIYIVSPVPAEGRLTMMLKHKLASLDANTTSSQKSKQNEIDIVDFLNKYGDKVVVEWLKDNMDMVDKLLDPFKWNDKGEDEIEKYEGVEGDASKLASRVALLTTEEQERFYQEVSERYTAYIDYLNGIGQNDLEITTMPLNAELKSSEVLVSGKNPGGGNVFADNANLERYEVDVLRKPMRASEVKKQTEQLTSGLDKYEYRDKLREQLNAATQKKLDELQAEQDEATKEAQDKAEAKLRKLAEKKPENYPEADMPAFIHSVRTTAEEEVAKKFEKRRAKINRNRTNMDFVFRNVPVGRVVSVPVGKKGDARFYTQGMLMGYKVKGDSMNPSSVTAVFATLDSRRRVEIPLSMTEDFEALVRDSQFNMGELGRITLDNWDSIVPDKQRKEVYIITGNIIQAMSTANEGQLISFTTKDGEIKQGILMPDKWEKKNAKKRTKINDPKILEALEGDTVIKSSDGQVSIEKNRQRWYSSGYQIRVPKSKQTGGKYFLDEGLRSLVKNADFFQSGGFMVGDIVDGNLKAVLDYLAEHFDMTTDVKAFEDEQQGDGEVMYREQEGEAVSGTGDMNEAANDTINKLGLQDRVTILDSTDGLTGKRKKAKGWFDTKTGKIVIVMPNCSSPRDVVKTILHEGVAHYGLRKLVGEKNMNEFLDRVFEAADKEVRGRIIDLAMNKYDRNFRKATEEYLAGLAEDTNFDNPTFLNKVKALLVKLLDKMGIQLGNGLTDNELRYILWKSYRNLVADAESLTEVARDAAMQSALEVGNFAPAVAAESMASEDNDVLLRDGDTYEGSHIRVPGVKPSDVPYSYDKEDDYYYVRWSRIRDPRILAQAELDEASRHRHTPDDNRIIDDAIEDIDDDIKDYEEEWARLDKKESKGLLRTIDNNSKMNYIERRIKMLKKAKEILNSLKSNNNPTNPTQPNNPTPPTPTPPSNPNPPTPPAQPQQPNNPVGSNGRNMIAGEYNRMTGANVDGVSGVKRGWEEFVRGMMDDMRPLEQMQQLIAKTLGRELRDSEKAYELQTQLTSKMGRQIEREQLDYMVPMLQQVTEAMQTLMEQDDLSRDEAYKRVNNYLLAKHGLERNEWFVKQGKKEKDRAGLRGLAENLGENPDDYKAVAERIVNEFEQQADTKALWKSMKALTGRMLEISYETGMINKDTFEDLMQRHKYYVPLRGFADGTAADMFDYVTQSPHFQNIFQKMRGRQSMADDPLANLMSMLHSAIVIGNQNEVMQKIYNLAVNSNRDLLRITTPWYEYDDTTDTWEEKFPVIPEGATADDIDAIVNQFEADMQQKKAQGKAKRKRNRIDVGKKLLRRQAKEHEMVAYIDGKPVRMYVAGNPLVAQAMNKVNTQHLNKVMQAIQSATRWYSAINTSWSPAFGPKNAMRDIRMMLFGAYTTGGLRKVGRSAKWIAKAGWALPRLLITGKMDGLVKKLGKTDAAKVEQWWNEFLDNGGETGFTRTLNAEKAKGEVKDMIRHMMNGSKDGENRIRKYTIGLLEWIGRYSEDISRFAAYCEYRANGGSVLGSIQEAKNVTVNFNVHGGSDLAANCRALYSFFNASMQGINRMRRLATEHPKRFAAGIAAMMLGGAVLPWLNMLMFAMLGGDDDDWRKYEELTEYTANHNMILYVGNHKFLSIPWSQELAPFNALGNIWFRQQMGWNKGKSVAEQWGDMFVDLSPISVTSGKKPGVGLVKTIMPSFTTPVWEALFNEDFTGSPLYRDNQWNKYDASWEKAYTGKTSQSVVDASKWLDEKTGVDINPAIAEHLFSGILGGMGRSGDKMLRFFTNGFQLQDAPFIRTMMFDSNPKGYIGAVQREYGRNAYEVLPEMKAKVEKADALEFARLVNTKEYQIANMVSIYKTGKDLAGNKIGNMGIDKMEKEYKKLAGMSDGSAEYREQLEAVRADITEAKMQMLDEIQQVIYEHSGDLRKKEIDYVRGIEERSKAKVK